ncbi:hypothetical protein BC827DRAFT_1276520 [Russula dissimulans]|nr:hypothetical protein BC827DRAFT_1276520 [Russula dissimulans]
MRGPPYLPGAYGLGWPSGSMALSKASRGGQAVIRFVCAWGILLDLEGLKKQLGVDPGSGSMRSKTEDELIVALRREKEFQPETERGEQTHFHLMTTIENTPRVPSSLCSPHHVAPPQSSFLYDGPGPWSRSAPLSRTLKAVIGSPATSGIIGHKVLSLASKDSLALYLILSVITYSRPVSSAIVPAPLLGPPTHRWLYRCFTRIYNHNL